MVCDKGAAPGFFMPTHNMHINVSSCLVTNKMDMLPIVNIPSFGVCVSTRCVCVPAPTMWQKTYQVKVKGQETLLYRSYMPCALGGKIEFVTSGQIPLPADALDDIECMQQSAQEDAVEEDEGWTWLDTVELIPVVGSIVGAVREGIKGNWGMMAMNIGFLALDIAGIVSFGATTVASSAGKAAVKAGVKVATKTSIMATAKSGLKTGAKLFAKGAMQSFKNTMSTISLIASKGKKCVLACFPAGTLIHTETGQRPIEEIKVGDKVWSFNEETKEIALKEVLHTMENEVDATIKLKIEDEEIETTAEHPFYVNNEWKDASYLEENDELISINKCKKSVKSSDYSYKAKKVFNFEVADWHTYFVGLLGLLVHNARPCLKMISKMPKWLQKIMKGNYFNFIREQYYKRIGGFSEIVLSNGKRLDSYIPGKEIISRKFTQLADITTDTAKKYIDEITKKYKPGTEIKNTKRNGDVISKGGNKLDGEMILEIPPQKKPIDPDILKHADEKKVIIRDTNGKIYN
jgi:hypothetical protein